ncbi:uncharacterized protein Ice2 [Oratosquilla oratoria]|uniref:uncharacterized protein Ice2 n=1 Tax=Oratosquilla oratoria TaxID=337810 RepID=UPI003F77473D
MENSRITFIPRLFCPKEGQIPVSPDDPFISNESLREFSCLFSQDDSGLPAYVTKHPKSHDFLDLTYENLKEVAEVQIKREKAAQEAENTKEKEKEAAELEEKRIKQALDTKVSEIFNEKRWCVKKECPVLIPNKSTLNHAEHSAYLRAFVKFQIKPPTTKQERMEYEQYMQLQSQVLHEQTCFLNLTYKVANMELDGYNAVPSVINEYVSEYYKSGCKRALQYPQLYIREQEIPLHPQDPQQIFKGLQFKHIGHLLSMGAVPIMMVPNPAYPIIVKLEANVAQSYPPDSTQDINKCYQKPEVSKDPAAEFLAINHGASIVLTKSSLKTIVDNGDSFVREWAIPVVVKSYSTIDDNGKEVNHRVVFIDKPLRKKLWTPLEKKHLFRKKAVMSRYLESGKIFKIRSPKSLRFFDNLAPIPTEDDRIKESVEYDDIFNSNDDTDYDVFGGNSTSSNVASVLKKNNKGTLDLENKRKKGKSSSKAKAKKSKVNSALESTKAQKTSIKDENNSGDLLKSQAPSAVEGSDTPQTSGFLNDLLSMQGSTLKNSHHKDSSVSPEEKRKKEEDQHYPWSCTLDTRWEKLKSVQMIPPESNVNLHYQLYSLGFDGHNSHSKTSAFPSPQKEHKIIVRHNLHGFVGAKSQRVKNPGTFVLYPKLENQPFFGCEVHTQSEIIQQWAELLVRPHTTLLEVRTCRDSGEVICSKEKDLDIILKEGKQPHINFHPNQALATLNCIFSAVSGLSSGSYLLHHDRKTAAFVHLMRAATSTESSSCHPLDLHNMYNPKEDVTTTNYKTAPWLAIDTHVLTPFHYKHEKIPATFPMYNARKFDFRSKQKRKRKRETKKMLVM